MPKLLYSLLILALTLLPISTWGQGGLLDELEEEVPCSAQLLAEVSAFQPGVPFEIGVWVEPLPGWHGYWHSPRDGGDPPEVFWDLPEGWKISPARFPAPVRMVEPGDLIAYGYKKPFMLLYTATPSAELQEGQSTIHLSGSVTWQVCKTTCLYGESDISLKLEAASQPVINQDSSKRIRGWVSSIPLKKTPKGFLVEQEWVPAKEKGSIAGQWVIRWARKGEDRRPAIPVRWQVFPHSLVAGILDEAKPERWVPDPSIHKGLAVGNQVTIVVRDVGEGFHSGLLGATMVPSPGKAKGPVSGFPAFECRGKAADPEKR